MVEDGFQDSFQQLYLLYLGVPTESLKQISYSRSVEFELNSQKPGCGTVQPLGMSQFIYKYLIIDSSGHSFGGGGGIQMVPGQTPTAMPALMSGPTPAPGRFETGQLQTVGRVRTEFPETWLWSSAAVGYVLNVHFQQVLFTF